MAGWAWQRKTSANLKAQQLKLSRVKHGERKDGVKMNRPDKKGQI